MIFDYSALGLLAAMVTVLVARAVRVRRWPRYHLMRELDPDWQHVREALHGRYGTTEREG